MPSVLNVWLSAGRSDQPKASDLWFMDSIMSARKVRRLTINVTESLRLRFAEGCGSQRANGCIEWQAAQRNGYGAIKHEKKTYQTHCVAWAIAGNEFIAGHLIGHKCDNRLCVNVEHLECITYQKNNKDAFIRRTRERPSGGMLPHTAVDTATALQIIELYEPRTFGPTRIAAMLNLDFDVVRRVIRGKTWPTLPRKDGMKIPIRQLAEKR